MGTRLRPAAYLGGTAALGVAAALLIVSLRTGVIGAKPAASPIPAPTRGAIAKPVAPVASPRLVTLPPQHSPPPTPAPTSAPVPEPTPWPTWLTIPDDTWSQDDPDRDGLTSARERGLGTEKYEWDTDFGGEGDGSEVAAGRDPIDRTDDVPAKSACIPEGAKNWDGSSPDEEPPPAPELEALLPREIAGVEMQIGSMHGLPRVYGFFNFFWDGILLCAGGQPDDLSHALGVRGGLPGFAIMAIRIRGADPARLARDVFSDLEAADPSRRVGYKASVNGREIRVFYDVDVDGISFASYATDDVLFLMTGMGATDAGLWPGGVLDPEHVAEAVAALPPR